MLINCKTFLSLLLLYVIVSLGCGPREPNAETIKYDLDKHFISLAFKCITRNAHIRHWGIWYLSNFKDKTWLNFAKFGSE